LVRALAAPCAQKDGVGSAEGSFATVDFASSLQLNRVPFPNEPTNGKVQKEDHMTPKVSPAAPFTIPVGRELAFAGLQLAPSYVGEKKNYNLQPGVTEYQLWSASTIEWVADQGKFKARVLLEQTVTKDIVALNSWHQDFADAERAIDLVRNSLNQVGDRRVYNVFGETIDVHTSPSPGGTSHYVIEVLALIWSMM
jgi:hypothetical protein